MNADIVRIDAATNQSATTEMAGGNVISALCALKVLRKGILKVLTALPPRSAFLMLLVYISLSPFHTLATNLSVYVCCDNEAMPPKTHFFLALVCPIIRLIGSHGQGAKVPRLCLSHTYRARYHLAGPLDV
jgi:hypothetical protein